MIFEPKLAIPICTCLHLSVSVRSIRSIRMSHGYDLSRGSRESGSQLGHAGMNSLMTRIERTQTDTDGQTPICTHSSTSVGSGRSVASNAYGLLEQRDEMEKAGDIRRPFRSTMHNVEALLALLGRLLRAALLLAGGLAARLLRRGLLFLGSHDSISIDRSETARPIPRWIGGAIRRQRTVVSLHGLREAREVEVLHLDGRHHDVAALFRAGESHRWSEHLEVIQHEQR
jgi:hypothetical protein